MKTDEIRQLPFFFILGRPRSGTTLLRTLLDAHPAVQIPLENLGMIQLLYSFGRKKSWNSQELDRLKAAFLGIRSVEGWQINQDRLNKQLHALPSDCRFSEILKIFYLNYQSAFDKTSIRWIGDKTPVNSLYAKKIFSSFSDAKYIHLVRDYRANLASMKKQRPFSPSETAMLMQWKRSVRQIERLSRQHPGRFLLLRYEDLAGEPEESFRKVCEFLEIEYIPALLDPGLRKKAVQKIYDPSFLNDWQPHLSEKISLNHARKWEKELSPASIAKADYVAGKTGKKYGYEPQTIRLSVFNIIKTELKKSLFFLNECNRYLYDRLPYQKKMKIKNRKRIYSYEFIRFIKRKLGRT